MKKSLFASLFFAAVPAFAATTNSLSNAPGIDLSIQNVFGIVNGLACWATRFVLVFIVIAIVWYGVQFMTSGGVPGKFEQAKKSLSYAIIGIIVVLGAQTIIATIAHGINPTGPNAFFALNCSAY